MSEQNNTSPEAYEKPGFLTRVASHHLAPYIAGAVIVLGCAVVAYQHLGGGVKLPGISTSPKVVLFDPVKFLNAQRAAASILASKPSADLALTITQVARQAEDVIRQEAKGAVVLIRQAVVLADDHTDITDKVLDRFGLPSNVPTVTTDIINDDDINSIAPSNSSFGRDFYEDNVKADMLSRGSELKADLELLDKQLNMIP